MTVAKAYNADIGLVGVTGKAINVPALSAFSTGTLTVGHSSGGAVSVTNYYGLFLGSVTVNATGTITNRWGIYQEDAAAINHLAGPIRLKERSTDPANPPEGHSVIWQSDGVGLGDDGDIMTKITAGGVTNVRTLADFSDPGGREWVLISTKAASGAEVAFTGYPMTYSELLLVPVGVSHDNGSNTDMIFLVSEDGGATYTAGGAVISNSIAASSSWWGNMRIPGYTFDGGSALSGINSSASGSLNVGLATARVVIWKAGGGMDAFKVRPNAGSFDAGTFYLYGR